MSEPRVIKKYPNRRLYDTVESRYITLADVRRLVVERIDFVVVDKKNNADITRSILLQVIAEQEHLAEPILSQDFMVNVIRSYGTSAQSAGERPFGTSLEADPESATDAACAASAPKIASRQLRCRLAAPEGSRRSTSTRRR